MSQILRIHTIDEFIKRFGKVSKSKLAQYLEVSQETIKKDIAFMRDFLKAPIKYDIQKRGYIYTQPFDYLSFATEENILFHVFIKALAEDLKKQGINYIPITSKDLLKNLSTNIKEEYQTLINKIEYHSSSIEKMDRKNFLSIIRAMRFQNKLKIEYINSQGKKSKRTIEPYKLINYYGNWYLTAYCFLRESLVTFLIARMEKVNPIDEEFDSRTTKKEVEEFINNSAGMYNSKETTTATIRFYEPAYYKVNKQIWHKKQKTQTGEINNKKYIDFTIPVGKNFEEILAKTMAYAPNSEVLSPVEFKTLWQNTIKEMYEKFGK